MSEYREWIVKTETRVQAKNAHDAVRAAIEVQSPYEVKAYAVHPEKGKWDE